MSSYDYILTPVIAVTVFGFIPVIVVGIWFGRQIKKHKASGNPKGHSVLEEI